MLYRIQIDQRLDKKKAVIDAVKELASDFVILSGTAYFSGSYRPCQIIEINATEMLSVGECVKKLKKVLNMPSILVTRIEVRRVVW